MITPRNKKQRTAEKENLRVEKTDRGMLHGIKQKASTRRQQVVIINTDQDQNPKAVKLPRRSGTSQNWKGGRKKKGG